MSIPVAHTLRDYQQSAEVAVCSEIAKLRVTGIDPYVLLAAPTGAGKTTIAAALIRRETEHGGAALFIAHRKELIEQCSARLSGARIQHGLVSAGHASGWLPQLPVQVASIGSLGEKRVSRLLHQPTLIIIDEAHRARAASYLRVLARFPGIPVIGLTATPVRSDNKGLGDLFRKLIVVETIAGLTERGYLVPATGFAYSVPDLSSVRSTAGDYNEHDLGEVMSSGAIVGDITSQWLMHAWSMRTVLFASTVAHSKALISRFVELGVKAEHVDGTTPKAERGEILARLESGETTLVSNVGVLTEGWDSPRVECCVLARPTKSTGLYLQMVGRVLRPVCRSCGGDTLWTSPGCRHCNSTDIKRVSRLHDHANCVMSHGLPGAERDWTLDVRSVKRPNDDEESALAVRQCPACNALYAATRPCCPECGLVPPRNARIITEVKEGATAISLEELAQRGQKATDGAKRSELRRLIGTARIRKLPRSWIYAQYKDTFGEEPRWRFQL